MRLKELVGIAIRIPLGVSLDDGDRSIYIVREISVLQIVQILIRPLRNRKKGRYYDHPAQPKVPARDSFSIQISAQIP